MRPFGIGDASPYLAALEYAAQTQAIVLGKPATEFFRSAAQQIGLDPSE